MTDPSHHRVPEQLDGLLIDSDSGDDDGGFQYERVLAVLRGRYHWIIVLGLILGTIGAVGGFFLKGPEYQGISVFRINPVIPRVLYDTPDKGIPPMFDSFVSDQLRIITSNQVIERAMQDPRWTQVPGSDQIDSKTFAEMIRPNRDRLSTLISIRFVSEDPRIAEAGANVVLDAYMKVFGQQQEVEEARVLEILYQKRRTLNDEVNARQDEQRALAEEFGSDNLDGAYNAKFGDVLGLEAKLADIQVALAAKGAGMSELSDQIDPETMTVEQLAAMDPGLADLLRQRQDLLNQIQAQRNLGRMDDHPVVRQHRANIRTLDEQVDNYVARVRARLADPDRPIAAGTSFDSSVEELRAQERKLKELQREARRELIELGKQNARIKALAEVIQSKKAELDEVTHEIKRRETESTISGRVEVVGYAELPAEPYNFGKRVQLSGMGGMFGASVGFGIVLLIGLLDPRFRHIDDATMNLPSTRVLGILPTLPNDIKDPEQAVQTAHAVHHIRTLLQIGRDSTGLVFSVTSPAPGSGKTSLTMALGISFASSGAKTLMIDADIVGGGLTRRLGIDVHKKIGQILMRKQLIDQYHIDEAMKACQVSGKRLGEALVALGEISEDELKRALAEQSGTSVGLLEACNGESFETCIAPTSVSGLYVLPIGSALPHQAGALSPSSLKRLISAARKEFDTVLIDTGPLLGSLEASMAASDADGTIMIISRGDQKPIVNRCVEHLYTIRARLSGVVFNHALQDDIARSTYGSVTMSQGRHPSHVQPTGAIDAATATRIGPLASAVAIYASVRESDDRGPVKRNGQSASHGAAAPPPNGTESEPAFRF